MTALLIPQQYRRVTLAIDFDGTLVEANVQPLRWRSNAREFVVAAARSGIQIVALRPTAAAGPSRTRGTTRRPF